jgi:hypothetical protein
MPFNNETMSQGKYIRTPEIRQILRTAQLVRDPNTVLKGDKHVNYIGSKNHNCVDCNKKLRAAGTLRCWECYKKYAVGINSALYKNGGYVLTKCNQCGMDFKKNTSEYNRNNKHFCSKDCCRLWVSLNKRGENSHSWKNGNTSLNLCIRGSVNSRDWKLKVFNRDGYTCKECGNKSVRGNAVYLEAHHIKEFAQIIVDNNIKSFDDALICDEMWDINNGVTLCRACHNQTKKGNVIKKKQYAN